jgi:hypothetical protein
VRVLREVRASAQGGGRAGLPAQAAHTKAAGRGRKHKGLSRGCHQEGTPSSCSAAGRRRRAPACIGAQHPPKRTGPAGACLTQPAGAARAQPPAPLQNAQKPGARCCRSARSPAPAVRRPPAAQRGAHSVPRSAELVASRPAAHRRREPRRTWELDMKAHALPAGKPYPTRNLRRHCHTQPTKRARTCAPRRLLQPPNYTPRGKREGSTGPIQQQNSPSTGLRGARAHCTHSHCSDASPGPQRTRLRARTRASPSQLGRTGRGGTCPQTNLTTPNASDAKPLEGARARARASLAWRGVAAARGGHSCLRSAFTWRPPCPQALAMLGMHKHAPAPVAISISPYGKP